MIPTNAVMRVGRPTDNLHEVTKMYVDGLGFEIIGGFDDHGDFSGRMIGHPKQPYHLEFTSHNTQQVGPAPTLENLLVYYLPDPIEFSGAIERISRSGFNKVSSINPYWEEGAQTFEDIDGYRVG
jgi:hypothetical protein